MVDSDGHFGEDDSAVLVCKRSQANEGIGEGRHNVPRHRCEGKRRYQSKGGAGHQAFRLTVCHTDFDGWSFGFVAGDQGIWSKVEATGVGVGNAKVKRWRGRGGIWYRFDQ